MKKFTLKHSLVNSGKNVLGLDLSLRGTGIAVLNDKGVLIHREFIFQKTRSIKKVKKAFFELIVNGVSIEEIDISNGGTGHDSLKRLSTIKNRILAIVKDYNIKNIMIEDYAYDANKGRLQAGRVFDLGELGGTVKTALFEKRCKIYKISPNSLKKFITTDGGGSKDSMIENIKESYGYELENDNEADAFALARCLLTLGKEVEILAAKGGAEAYLKQIEEKYKFEMKISLEKDERKMSDADIKRLKMFLLAEGLDNIKSLDLSFYKMKLEDSIRIKEFHHRFDDVQWMPRRKDSFYLLKCPLNNKTKTKVYIVEHIMVGKKYNSRSKKVYHILMPKVKNLDTEALKIVLHRNFIE